MEAVGRDAYTLRKEEAPIHQVASSIQLWGCSGTRGCYHCGSTAHHVASCHFKDVICHNCHKKGHLKKVCQSKGTTAVQATQLVQDGEAEEEPLSLFHLGARQEHPITTKVMLNGTPVTIEIDTDAAVSIMSSQQKVKLFPEARLQPSNVKLRTYTKEPIPVLGVMPVQVICGEQKKNLSLVVVQDNGPTLLGRDWLSHLRLDWKSIAYQAKEHPK